MVFSSVAAYLDPSNWQQQQTQELAGSSSLDPLLPPPSHPAPPPPPQPQPQLPHGGGIGSIRPGSMAERARLANIRMPEAALKCPRCESTNTKFCYFNNYSLTQPRHFCKTCRRYWTRGGALRNVPVGGGCRRNRRSKSASSKSPESRDRGSATAVSTSHGAANTLGLTPQLPPLRLVSPLSQLNDNFTSDMGLNYSGISADEINFHAANINVLGGGGIEPWRSQQFSFFGGLDPSSQGIYQFQGGELGHQVRPKFPSSLLTSVKMEENPEMSLSKQLQGGMAPTNDQWNASAAWTDF